MGRGFSIIDSSICVAVMTGLRNSAGAADDVLLNGGNLFRRNLDAQIAAGHHDAVSDVEDCVEVLDGLGLFKLGDDPGFAAVGGDTVAHQANVFSGADEGDGDGVDAVLESEFQVLIILFGEGWNAAPECRED